MSKGINLTLMIGPAIPVPVPREMLDALVRVQIATASGDTHSGFELTFSLSNRSPLHTLFLLSGGASIPVVRVIILVTVHGRAEVLMDGVMTHHEIKPGTKAGESVLIVKGKDLTALMNIIDFSGVPYPAMPPAARVLLVLAKYAVLGIVPMVIPSVMQDFPNPLERIPRHQGKDLDYVRQLAEEVGYVFYIEPGPAPGTSVAYWGPEVKAGIPQPALNIDMDAHTNVESLSFTFDKEHSETPVVYVQEPMTKVPTPIPIPDITPLNPPLGMIPPFPSRLTPLTHTAGLSPLQAAMEGMAYASKHADAVSGSGRLNVLRYGRVLKARQLVGVRGAGPAFNGLYYVKSVTHEIKRGEYKQNFTIVRNRLISTLPRVPV